MTIKIFFYVDINVIENILINIFYKKLNFLRILNCKYYLTDFIFILNYRLKKAIL